jgi:MFS family permease
MLAALSAVFIGAIDLSIVATILPSIVSDLNVNTADIDRYIWVVNSYLIAYIAAIPLAGRLSDLIGRRGVFLGCLALFLAGSVVCATATTLDGLIVARAIQGFGGGGLIPVTMALAGDLFSRKSHLSAIGAIASIETLGWIVGPTYGAVVTTLTGNTDQAWRWVFWLNVPIGLFIAWNVRKRIPGAPIRDAGERVRQLDVPGALALTGMIVFVCLGLTSSGEISSGDGGLRAFGGTPNPLADRLPILLGLAGLCLVGLVLRQRTATWPILPMQLLRHKGFASAIVANFMVGTVMMIGIVNVPVVVALLISSGDVSWTSALLLAPLTIGIAVAAALGGWIESRLTGVMVIVVGSLASAVGFASLYPLLDSLDVWRMIPGLTIAGLGIGLLLPPLGTAALRAADSAHHGTAASMLIMVRLLGMTIGISGLSAIGVYRLQELTDRLDPVMQEPSESTASFLARQQQFIVDHAIPQAVQVMQETFAVAAFLAIFAMVPLLAMQRSGASQGGDVGCE